MASQAPRQSGSPGTITFLPFWYSTITTNIFFQPVVPLLGMATALIAISNTASADPFTLVLKGKQALGNLDFQRKRLDRLIESIQRLRHLGAHSAEPRAAVEGFRTTSVIPFPAVGPRKNQPISRNARRLSAVRSNLLYFPRSVPAL